jgi:hypothetical protein
MGFPKPYKAYENLLPLTEEINQDSSDISEVLWQI